MAAPPGAGHRDSKGDAATRPASLFARRAERAIAVTSPVHCTGVLFEKTNGNNIPGNAGGL